MAHARCREDLHASLLLVLTVSLASALMLAGPATAAAPSGSYRGSTSQDRTVHVTITRGKITNLSFSVYTLCGTGGSGGGMSDVLAVRGVEVKGNGSYAFSSGCQTFDLTFTAKRR